MRGFMADERRPGSTPNAKPVLKAVK